MIIISYKPGQLGNSLFLFAHLIAFAGENTRKRHSIYNPSFHEYENYFESTHGHSFCCYPKSKGTFLKNSFFKKIAYNLCYYSARIIHRSGINNSLVKCIHLDAGDSFDLCNGGGNLTDDIYFFKDGTSAARNISASKRI